jgi:hypothetical protein
VDVDVLVGLVEAAASARNGRGRASASAGRSSPTLPTTPLCSALRGSCART